MLEKTKVWYSIQNGGDGSAYPSWWLSQEEAEWEQDNMDEGWGECCRGSVETFIGSDIYKEGIEQREKNQKIYKAKKEGIKLPEGEYSKSFKKIILTKEERENLDFLNEPPIDEWDLD